MNAPQYDKFQQAFALSMLSNAVSNTQGSAADLTALLAKKVNATLADGANQALVGAWSVVWGPQIWQKPDTNLAANAMYVAHNPAVPGLGDTYVVAIAATNEASKYDWLLEDADVWQTVNFSTWDPLSGQADAAELSAGELSKRTTPHIAKGTAVGVQQLLEMVSPAGCPASGQSLTQFLGALKNVGSSTLIATGHSLAGALSPTLALYLKTRNLVTSFGNMFVYPTAGATPGNQSFANLFNSTLPQAQQGTQTYQVWNTDLWNSIDVVPHAWNQSDLAMIPQLYGTLPLLFRLEVNAIVELAQADARLSLMSYERIQNASFPGTVNPEVSVVPPNDMKALFPPNWLPPPAGGRFGWLAWLGRGGCVCGVCEPAGRLRPISCAIIRVAASPASR